MILHGSDINEKALREVKSLDDLIKLNIFSHLPNEKEANADLLKAIKPDKPLSEPDKPKLSEPDKPKPD